MNKKAITEYYGIELKQKVDSGVTYYDASFIDSFGEEFFFRFFNSPYDLEGIEVLGKIEFNENVIIFTDDIDSCENFWDNAIGFPVFLQKISEGSSELRSIQDFNFSEYNNEENTFVHIKQIGFLGSTRIEKSDEGYLIYVKNCEIEKSFERFVLASYLNRNNITLPNQVIE
jgi:hypothetical protein